MGRMSSSKGTGQWAEGYVNLHRIVNMALIPNTSGGFLLSKDLGYLRRTNMPAAQC
jgi:hypothetical protein